MKTIAVPCLLLAVGVGVAASGASASPPAAGPPASARAAGTARTSGAESASARAAGTAGAQQLNDAFLKAMEAGDIDGVMRLYAADAVLFPPGEKAARGQDEIRFKWNDFLQANKVTEGSLTEAKYVSAPTVSAGWGNVAMRLEPKNGKEPKTIQGRFSTIAEKRNGKWAYVFVGIGELDEVLTLKHYSKTK
jgi:ketosteroid isomerase-like protein